jgi:threonine dehydratase
MLPTLEGVRRAAAELRAYVKATPLVQSLILSDAFGARVWIKNETVSPIGCFKLRGALIDILRASRSRKLDRVVTSSSGNHGQGVAYAAKTLGLSATIFLPEGANVLKLQAIELLDAEIRTIGSDSHGTKQEARRFAEQNGHYFIDDGSSLDLAEGAGTVGLEIAEELPSAGAIFFPVGDAALVAGSGAALKALNPSASIIGVQAKGAPAYALSHQSKSVMDHSVATIADGLATRSPAPFALAAMIAFIDRFVLVEEHELLSAVHSLAVAAHVLAEPSGAATLAAAWADRARWQDKDIVIVVSGSNIEAHILRRALAAPPLW